MIKYNQGKWTNDSVFLKGVKQMELHQLVTFRMVALTLHFSRAAEALNDVLSNFSSLRLVLFEFTYAFEPLVGSDPTDCYKEGHS